MTALKGTTKMALGIRMLVLLAIGFWLGSCVLNTAHSEAESVPNEIRARKFVVVDDTGKDRAEFGITEDGEAGMVVWNKKKSTAVSVSINRYGMPRITFENSKGEALLDFGIFDDQYPVFIMRDANGLRRLAMAVTDAGLVTLRLYDSRKQDRCAISLTGDGNPLITLNDDKGKVRASLIIGNNGTCALVLFNRKEQERIVFQVDAEGQADAAVFGPDGKATWSAAKP